MVLVLWASPAAADITIGGNCTSTPGAQSAQSGLGGNNVICVSNAWQYPAYQFGSTSAACNSTNAGIMQWTGAAFQFCNGSTWTTVNGVATSVPLSGITAATGSQTFDSGSNPQTWEWGTLTSGTALTLTTSSMTGGTLLSLQDTAAAATSTGKVLNVTDASTGTGYGVYSAMTATTGNTGYAGYFLNTSTNGGFGIAGVSDDQSGNGAGVFADCDNANCAGLWASSAYGTGIYTYGGAYGISAGGGAYGIKSGGGSYGIYSTGAYGGYFVGTTAAGVYAGNWSSLSGSGLYAEEFPSGNSGYAVYGINDGAGNTGYAGYFTNTSTAFNYGVYATSATTTSGYAGYFANTATINTGYALYATNTGAGYALGATGTSTFNGNVGIGTTSPNGELDVSDGTSDLYVSNGGGYPRLYFGGTAGSTVAGVLDKVNGSTTLYFGETADTGGYQFRGSGNSYIQGNVGIGTTAPGAALDVQTSNTSFPNGWTSNLQLDGQYPTIYFHNSNNNGYLIGQNSGGNNSLYFGEVYGGVLQSYPMVLTSAGHVEIGTTSNLGNRALTIEDNGEYQLELANTNTGGSQWAIGVADNSFASGGSKLVIVPMIT